MAWVVCTLVWKLYGHSGVSSSSAQCIVMARSCLFPPSSHEEAEPPSRVNGHTGVSTHLTSLALPGKAESVASLTSQCSYSSTIVHVGDKKPQPELGISMGSWIREKSDF